MKVSTLKRIFSGEHLPDVDFAEPISITPFKTGELSGRLIHDQLGFHVAWDDGDTRHELADEIQLVWEKRHGLPESLKYGVPRL